MPAVKQFASTLLPGTGATGAITISASQVGESLIVGIALESGGTAYAYGVTDNGVGGSNTYVGRTVRTQGARSVRIFDCVKPTQFGVTTITVTGTGGTGNLFGDIGAARVTGLAGFDQEGGAVNASATAVTATCTAPDTTGQDFVIACASMGAGTTNPVNITDPPTGGATWTSGVVNQNDSTNSGSEIAYRINAISTTDSAAWTISTAAGPVAGAIASYKAAATASASIATFHPGRGPGQAPQSARFYQSPKAYNVVASSPDVTLNLTGQTATFTQGAIARAVDYSLTGQTATFTEGALSASISYALTAQTGTFTEGSLARAIDYSLTGQTATFTEGTVTASVGGDVTLSLTGQTATFTEGSLSANLSYALTGQSATFSEGAIAQALSYAIAGQTATFSEGAITAQAGGDVTIQLSGLQAAFTIGVLTPSGADVVNLDTHDGGRKRKKRFDDAAQTQVIRESALKPIQRPQKKSATVTPAPVTTFDARAEDEELLLLQLDEDERLNRILELAASVLQTLH